MAFLVERKNSPTRDRLRAELEAKYPGMIWCEYEPLGALETRKRSQPASDKGIRLIPKFERADVIVALTASFLTQATRVSVLPTDSFHAAIPIKRAHP